MPKTTPAIVPPQEGDAEESVIGAVLLSPNVLDTVAEILTPDDFYFESNGRIFAAAQAMHLAGHPVDAITLTAYMEGLPGDGAKTAGGKPAANALEAIGGRVRLHELANLVPATANAAHYARLVRDAATLRAVLTAGQEMTRLALDRQGTVADVVEEAERLVFDAARGREAGRFAPIRDTVAEAYKLIQDLHERGGYTSGLTTGLVDFDRLTSGLQPGELIIVGARPSMGKSSIALGACADITLRQKLPVALFTLEMSRSEVVRRLMGMEGRIDGQRIRTGRLESEDWHRLNAASARLQEVPLYVEDAGLVTIAEIRSKSRKLKARLPDLALIVVDYLQLMAGGGPRDDRVRVVSEISRGLKILARELELPVLALSQLSRNLEQRHDKRPILSDLRESGSLEQDADVVAFLYRDEYYFPEDEENKGVAELNVAKQRNGPTGLVKLSWLAPYAKFSNLSHLPSVVPG